MEDYSKHIIDAYFGKHFSERARKLFGRWLRSEDGEEQKEMLLRQAWEQSAVEATDSTRRDWTSLHKHLYNIPVAKRSNPFGQQLLKYAAVAAIVLLVALSAYLIMNRATVSKPIEMAEFFVPYGESRMVTLPDSSKVWVDAGSILIYPKDFKNTKTRSVYLNGKASFTVEKNPQKPFIVKTNHLNVQALGTIFTVKSYPSDAYVTATLERGSVRVDVRDGSVQSSILKPNEQLTYSTIDHSVDIQTVDAALYSKERQGYLIFDHVSFDQMMSTLERHFNVTVQYNTQKYSHEYYNVKFMPQEKLSDVLNVLQQLAGIHYVIKGNEIIIN